MTDERIDFVDAPEQVCPALARRGGGGRCWLHILGGVVLDLSGLIAPTLTPGGIRVEAVVAHEMLTRRRDLRQHPCDNVFNNPRQLGGTRWVAFPKPQGVVQYFDGRTGELRYAEAIVAN